MYRPVAPVCVCGVSAGRRIRDLPDTMPRSEPAKVRNAKGVDSTNRQGSLLDFIDDFAQRFPACLTSTTRC